MSYWDLSIKQCLLELPFLLRELFNHRHLLLQLQDQLLFVFGQHVMFGGLP